MTRGTSRRQFIRHGLAASMLAACSPPLRAALVEREREPSQNGCDEPYGFFTVLYDNDSDAGRAFGAEAARRGLRTRGVGLDLGGLWLHEIGPRWQRGPAALAGLTRGAPLFCLELLAQDYGMSVVYRARHDVEADGLCRHTLMGPACLSSWSDRLAAAGRDWPGLAAELATGSAGVRRPCRGLGLVDLAEPSEVATRSLYSWVMAPADGTPGLAVRGL